MSKHPHEPGAEETAGGDRPVDENKPVKPPAVRQIVLGGAAFLLFLTLLTLGINAIGVDNIQQTIRDAGVFAPLLYIAIKALTYIFAPLTSGPIQVVAGTLFDSLWLGVLYTLIGEVLGGSVSFWIARRFGRPAVERFVGSDNMQRVDTFYREQLGGAASLAVARIILFSLWDFLSYAAGLAKPIRFRTYVLVSAVLGFFPTFFFVWIGNRAVMDTSSLLLIYGLVAVLILLPIVFRQQIARLLQWTGSRQSDSDSDETSA
jgi:uncharacterized membrane protein YdjX (TVP38/TMEM64 family)